MQNEKSNNPLRGFEALLLRFECRESLALFIPSVVGITLHLCDQLLLVLVVESTAKIYHVVQVEDDEISA